MITLLSAFPVPASAAVSLPTVAVISSVYAYQNILEMGDQFYLVSYKITYTTAPTGYTARDLFFIRLLDSSGREYASQRPYPYYNAGFSYGMTGFYFTSADVEELGIPFGAGYGTQVQLNYNPTVDWEKTPSPYSLSTFNLWYSSPTPQSALTARFRIAAQEVEDEWGGVIDIISGAVWARTLTVYGEDYFTNAIPNIINLCPMIFSSSKEAPMWPSDIVIADCFIVGDSDVTIPIYGGTMAMQGWRASGHYLLDWVELRIGRTGTPSSDLHVDIYHSGSPVAFGTVSASAVSETPDWVNVVVNPQFSTSHGGEYDIHLSTSGGDASNAYLVSGYSGGGYAYGTLMVYPGTGSWIDTGDDLLFITHSADGKTAGYSNKWAHRLDGSPFDLRGAADAIGLSPMWLRGLVWFMFTLLVVLAIVRVTMNIRLVLLTTLMMTAIGAAMGFLYITFAAFIMFVSAILVIYSLFWEKSSA